MSPMRGDDAVVRLRPIRVLLVGRDRRFLRSAAVLLSRRRCEVMSIERPSELLRAIECQRTDVVVLDGTGSIYTTARAVAALAALPVPVPSLVVHERAGEDHLQGLPLLPKWGDFDNLAAEVERMYLGGAPPVGTAEALH